MKHQISDPECRSECCDAYTVLYLEDPEGHESKEIFYFKCTKCKRPCHLKHDQTKHRKTNKEV